MLNYYSDKKIVTAVSVFILSILSTIGSGKALTWEHLAITIVVIVIVVFLLKNYVPQKGGQMDERLKDHFIKFYAVCLGAIFLISFLSLIFLSLTGNSEISTRVLAWILIGGMVVIGIGEVVLGKI